MTIKITKVFITFCLILLLLYYSISVIFFKNLINIYTPVTVPSRSFLTFKNFDYNKKYDVVFVGSSHSYRSFDPRIFISKGLSAYNVGTTSQSALNSYAIIKKIIPNARRIVLEVYPIMADSTGRESYCDLLPSMRDYLTLAEMALYQFNLRDFQLLSVKPILDYKNRNHVVDSKNFYFGYVETDGYAPRNTVYSRYTLSGKKKQLHYVDKIVKLCKHNHVDVCLIYAPVPKELVVVGENSYIAELERIAKENSVVFYNYGRTLNMDSRLHFFDDDHLNKEGVKILNNKFLFDAFSIKS